MSPILLWVAGSILSGFMPNLINQTDNFDKPPSPTEAKGAPLSVLIASGNPYSLKALSN